MHDDTFYMNLIPLSCKPKVNVQTAGLHVILTKTSANYVVLSYHAGTVIMWPTVFKALVAILQAVKLT